VTARFWLLPVAGAFALAACSTFTNTETTPMRTATTDAETACIRAVNTNYGGDGAAAVTTSEFSEANSTVMLTSRDGETWRCRASNEGVVEDLAVTR
jgi:hypothetical protein